MNQHGDTGVKHETQTKKTVKKVAKGAELIRRMKPGGKTAKR